VKNKVVDTFLNGKRWLIFLVVAAFSRPFLANEFHGGGTLKVFSKTKTKIKTQSSEI
jgi:hypothetical protein